MVRVPGSVLGIDPVDAPGELAAGQALDLHLRGHAAAQPRDVGHRHLRLHLEPGQVDDRQQRRVERHLLARLHVALRDRARDRRAHHRVGHQQLRLLELRAGGRDRGELRLVGAVRGVEGVLRNEVLLDELGVGLARPFGGGELRPGRLVRSRSAPPAGRATARCRTRRPSGRPSTRSPSRTSTRLTSADSFARTVACEIAWTDPGIVSSTVSRFGWSLTTSVAANSSGGCSRFFAASASADRFDDGESRRAADRGDGERADDGQPPPGFPGHLSFPLRRRPIRRARARARGTRHCAYDGRGLSVPTVTESRRLRRSAGRCDEMHAPGTNGRARRPRPCRFFSPPGRGPGSYG